MRNVPETLRMLLDDAEECVRVIDIEPPAKKTAPKAKAAKKAAPAKKATPKAKKAPAKKR